MPGEVKEIEKTGKTIEEAVEIALAELGINREDAEIEVLEEGNKGLFGIIGSRAAKVRVKENKRPEKVISTFLDEVFAAMGIEADLDFAQNEDQYYVSLKGRIWES